MDFCSLPKRLGEMKGPVSKVPVSTSGVHPGEAFPGPSPLAPGQANMPPTCSEGSKF